MKKIRKKKLWGTKKAQWKFSRKRKRGKKK